MWGMDRFRLANLGVATPAECAQLSLVPGALIPRDIRRPTTRELQKFVAAPDTPTGATIELLQFDAGKVVELGSAALLESAKPRFTPSANGRPMDLGHGVEGRFVGVTYSRGYHQKTGTFIEPVVNPHSESKDHMAGAAVGPHVDNWFALSEKKRLESPRRVGLVLDGRRSLLFAHTNAIAIARALRDSAEKEHVPSSAEHVPSSADVREYLAKDLGELSCFVVELQQGEGYILGSELAVHDSVLSGDSKIAFWTTTCGKGELGQMPPWKDSLEFPMSAYCTAQIERGWPSDSYAIAQCYLESFYGAVPEAHRKPADYYADQIHKKAAEFRKAIQDPENKSAIFVAYYPFNDSRGPGERIGAFAQASIINDENWINAFYSNEFTRGRGINQRLLEHSLAWLPPGDVYLRVDKNAIPAVKVYEKALFEATEETEPLEHVHPGLELMRMKLPAAKREAALNILHKTVMEKRERRRPRLLFPGWSLPL